MTSPSCDLTGKGKARPGICKGSGGATINLLCFQSSAFESITIRHTNTVQESYSATAVSSDFPICLVLLAINSAQLPQETNAILPHRLSNLDR